MGFLGVSALVGLDVSGSSWLSVAAVGITVLGYSLGPIIVEKRLHEIPSLPVIAAALALNAVIYAPFAWAARPTESVPGTAWASMAVLGVLCTAIAFVFLFALIGEVGAPRAQVITYINPAVALLLGVRHPRRATHPRDRDRVPAGARGLMAGHPRRRARRGRAAPVASADPVSPSRSCGSRSRSSPPGRRS